VGKWLIIAGAVLVVIGALVQFAPWTVSWFGRLPGDIRYESGTTRVYIPITSMILVSVILSVIVGFLRK
jgi:hypothetical protein